MVPRRALGAVAALSAGCLMVAAVLLSHGGAGGGVSLLQSLYYRRVGAPTQVRNRVRNGYPTPLRIMASPFQVLCPAQLCLFFAKKKPACRGSGVSWRLATVLMVALDANVPGC